MEVSIIEPHLLTALFARYDTKLRGFIGFYEFIEEMIGSRLMEERESHTLTQQLQTVLGTVRQTGSLEGVMDPIEEVRRLCRKICRK
jgi:hypothetical protein